MLYNKFLLSILFAFFILTTLAQVSENYRIGTWSQVKSGFSSGSIDIAWLKGGFYVLILYMTKRK